MSQSSYAQTNKVGAAYLSDLNAHLSAIVSNNSGSSAPDTFAGMFWFDSASSPWTLKVRSHDDASWAEVFKSDGAIISGAVPWATPGTIGSGTPSTGAFTTLSSTGAVTHNPAAADVNLQIGTDGTATALDVDGNGSSEANGLVTLNVPFHANSGFARGAALRLIAIDAGDDLTITDEDDLILVTTGTSSTLNTIIGGYSGQEIRLKLALLDTMTINHNTAGVGKKIFTHTAAAVSAGSFRYYNLTKDAAFGGWILSDI